MQERLSRDECAALERSTWLGALDAALGAALLRNARVVRLTGHSNRPGPRIALSGALCAVAGGAAKVSRTLGSGRDLAIGLMEPGAWFSCGPAPGDSHGTVPAAPAASYAIEGRGALVLLVVDARELAQLKQMFPALFPALLGLNEQLVHRLQEMLEELNDMPLATRVARQLSALGQRFGVAGAEGLRLNVRVSQQDLADLTGACRQRVNAELKAFERRGMLRMEGGQLALLPALAGMPAV